MILATCGQNDFGHAPFYFGHALFYFGHAFAKCASQCIPTAILAHTFWPREAPILATQSTHFDPRLEGAGQKLWPRSILFWPRIDLRLVLATQRLQPPLILATLWLNMLLAGVLRPFLKSTAKIF